MATACTRCEGRGFLNVPEDPKSLPFPAGEMFERGEYAALAAWLQKNGGDLDMAVCDCCGDGAGWYGEPGLHYGSEDPQGKDGPYAYNGGLCECH